MPVFVTFYTSFYHCRKSIPFSQALRLNRIFSRNIFLVKVIISWNYDWKNKDKVAL